MFFYIDPGTGSMLFTILIGLLGAAIYALRNVWVKLRFLMSGGKEAGAAESASIAFFTDDKRYWSIFKPLCDEMERRGQAVTYLTASRDDPILDEKYQFVKTEFIGEGNKAFAHMNLLKANVVLSSTPGLDVYQWKRSRDVKWYAHVLHAANDVTIYRMFGLDYYDAILVSGEYQIRQIRQLEALRRLPEKETILAGLPHLDAMRERLLQSGPIPEHETTVLLAPSWGPNSIFNRYGAALIDRLIATGHHIVIRPHPQSRVSEKDMLDKLMQAYPANDRLEWNFDNDNFEVLKCSDILISDFSGVIFDFTLVFEKPIIYADVSFDDTPYDAGWLEEKPWTFTILNRLGMQLTAENAGDIGQMIEHCLHAPEFREGREQARSETWVNIGHSVEHIADYLIDKNRKLQEQAVKTDSPAARKVK